MGITNVVRKLAPSASAPDVADQAVLTEQRAIVVNITASDTATQTDSSNVFDRNNLVLEVDRPDTPGNTGLIPNISLTTVTGNVNINLSTPGMVYENKDVFGRLSVTAANVTIRNCRVRGVPGASNPMIACTNSGVVNLLIEDCLLQPDDETSMSNGIEGHDFTARRVIMRHCQDGAQVKRSGATWPFDTNAAFYMCWVYDMAWLTAATGGIVHPTDTETHNDGLQLMQGGGAIVQGCVIDCRFAKQWAHWYVTNPNAEPYTTVTLNSLPDGGPYQHIPDRNITTGSSTINGNTSNAANGRYNWDDQSCLMIGDEEGSPTFDLHILGNWLYGGNFSVNGGGNDASLHGGAHNIGEMKRNWFDRSQGSRPSETATNTINFQGAGWTSARADIPLTGTDANRYLDDNSFITVRY